MELAEAPDDRAVGDDASEGDAGGGGTDEIGWRRQPEENILQEFVRDRQRGRGHLLTMTGLKDWLIRARSPAALALVRRATAHRAARGGEASSETLVWSSTEGRTTRGNEQGKSIG